MTLPPPSSPCATACRRGLNRAAAAPILAAGTDNANGDRKWPSTTSGRRRAPPARSTTRTAELDAGLRKHMLGIYNYMASGVLLTGIVAYLVFTMAVVQTAERARWG